MHTYSALLIVGLLAASSGCRSTDYNARVFHPWGYEDAADAKAHFDRYKHVLVVCVYEDHWEDRGPNTYSIHHFKGTVVKVYKGDWHISERVAFLQGLDYPALTTTNASSGSLVFIFTDQHNDTEIGLDTGEFSRYDAKYLPALECIYPQKISR